MERNLRIAAPFAGGAVVISLLVALFAGVPFGTAVLRAVLSGGAFGLLSLGVAILAQTQLPGFGGPPDSDATGTSGTSRQDGESQADAPQSGSRLNIVVEDDEEPAEVDAATDTAPGADGSTETDADADTDAEETETASPRVEGADSVPSREPAAAERAGSGPPAATGTGSEAPNSADGAAFPDASDDEDDQVEELVEEVEESSADDEEAVMKAAISEEQDGTSVEIDDTMLDEMPDIGSFAGSFVSGGDSESDETGDAMGGAGETGTLPGGTKQKKGDPRKGFDNKSIAKALQTFMAKDSE